MKTMKFLMKTILLTGCTRGLGLALTRYFAKAKYRVVACGRSADKVEAMQEELGSSHSISVVDVSDDAAVAAWAAQVIRSAGAPDLLINNAAVIARNAPLWEVPIAEFDQVMDVNIKGTANVLRHFLPAMIARKRGVIVNFSSGWGRSTSPEVAAYCASKWAIEGLTQALAQELPAGLSAVALNPGIIDTEMLQSCFGEGSASYPDPEEWVQIAGPYIDSLGARDNGRAVSVPI